MNIQRLAQEEAFGEFPRHVNFRRATLFLVQW
jgi:hypothetical protein